MNSSCQKSNVVFFHCSFRAALALIAIVGTSFVTTNAHAELYWTPWVSEENGGPPTYCGVWNEASVGFACSGGYCDNVSLLCETLPFNATLNSASEYWTAFFSEEDRGVSSVTSEGWYRYDGDNYEVCHRSGNPGLVSGIKCKGSYCDNISLKCAQPIKWKNGISYPVQVNNCQWSGWYSEEQRSVDFGPNRYITGVRCQGGYCDNKQFYVCSLIDPAP